MSSFLNFLFFLIMQNSFKYSPGNIASTHPSILHGTYALYGRKVAANKNNIIRTFWECHFKNVFSQHYENIQ